MTGASGRQAFPPISKGVIYQAVYKGIDLKVFGNGTDIEYEFIVNPGGNPGDILLTYNGIKGLATNGEGELLIGTAFGELKETRPYVYQKIEGKRVVDGSFEIRRSTGQSQTRRFSYGFKVASYNPSYPLIIDPTLSYSTYLGGSDDDYGYGITVDSSGNAYVTGWTKSSNFPTKNPYKGTMRDNDNDAFVTKLEFSETTLSLTYSTYLGGSDYDSGYGIAVDSSGNAYVTGWTESDTFPTKNPFQGTFGGAASDAFVTKLRDTVSPTIPTPDIKANGQEDSVIVAQGTPVSITISLAPGDKAGENADWWVAVNTPFASPANWYSCAYPARWMTGINHLYVQAPLVDLSPVEVLNMTLPLGNYTFYFAIDDPDGAPTGPWWGLDSVVVTVQ